MIDKSTSTTHRPDDSAPPTSDPFGPAVGALATLANVPAEQAALQAAVVLAALAGPRAGLVTLGGEFQPVGINILSTGGDTPEQARLVNLLFAPLRFLQDDLHDYSRRVRDEVADRMTARFTGPRRQSDGERRLLDGEEHERAERDHLHLQAERSTNAVSLSHPLDRLERFQHDKDLDMTCGAALYAIPEQHALLPHHYARCLSEPTVFLDCPSAAMLHRALLQCDRQSPLLLDAHGGLIEAAGDPANFRTRQAMEDIVIHGVTIGNANTGTGTGSITQSRGTLFSVTTRRTLERLLGSDHTGPLFSRLLLTDLRPADGSAGRPVEAGSMESGYTSFRKAVQAVLRLRRLDAPGIYPILDPVAAGLLFDAQRRFLAQINEVRPELRHHAAKFHHLPATLLWALHHLWPGRSCADLVPTALHLAEVAMTDHLRLAGHALANAGRERLERRAWEMLRKLAEVEPCGMRDLMRKYAVQRRALHQPVLDFLLETGRVLQIDEGRLRLSDEAKLELLETPAK